MRDEGESLWYVASVIDFVVETLYVLTGSDQLREKYYVFCKRKNVDLTSPQMGIFNASQRKQFIKKYLDNPKEGVRKMMRYLE